MDTTKTEQVPGEQRKARKRLKLDLPPKKNPRQWVHAAGCPESRHAMAVFYLWNFDYESAFQWDHKPEWTLAKIVCNLRNYHLQSKDATIKLVREFFNPRAGYNWSAEGIGLTWDLVESYTPSLGLEDPIAVARERAADVYDRVVDLVLLMEPGGRVLVTDLYEFFLSMNPDMDPVPSVVAFGIAVGDVTGKTSGSSKGKRYYSGFRIPKNVGLQVAA